MAKYTSADCRLCRREGCKLFLKGDRCISPKCAMEKRPVVPGQHGLGRKKEDKGNDNQSILDVSTHIELLDEYAAKDLGKIKEEYKILYEEYLEIKAELAKNYGDDKEKQRKLDLLKYQYDEIEKEANARAEAIRNEREDRENGDLDLNDRVDYTNNRIDNIANSLPSMYNQLQNVSSMAQVAASKAIANEGNIKKMH